MYYNCGKIYEDWEIWWPCTKTRSMTWWPDDKWSSSWLHVLQGSSSPWVFSNLHVWKFIKAFSYRVQRSATLETIHNFETVGVLIDVPVFGLMEFRVGWSLYHIWVYSGPHVAHWWDWRALHRVSINNSSNGPSWLLQTSSVSHCLFIQ